MSTTTQKVIAQEPVSSSTSMMKLAQAKLQSSSATPVSAVTDSTGAGSMTDQQLPMMLHDPLVVATSFLLTETEIKKPSLFLSSQNTPVDLKMGDDSLLGALFSPEDAVRQVGSYEKALEATEIVPKKVTKAFG